ncbi:MAG: hypothetical protein QXN56_01355 [Candidatus Hadarchaeum sp.]
MINRPTVEAIYQFFSSAPSRRGAPNATQAMGAPSVNTGEVDPWRLWDRQTVGKPVGGTGRPGPINDPMQLLMMKLMMQMGIDPNTGTTHTGAMSKPGPPQPPSPESIAQWLQKIAFLGSFPLFQGDPRQGPPNPFGPGGIFLASFPWQQFLR